MLIRKRIIISNIVMIVIPVVLIVVASGLLYLSYMHLYDLPHDLMEDGGDKSVWAQHSVEEYLNRLQYSQENSDYDKRDLSDILEHLKDGGFYCEITQNGKVIASNYSNEIKLQADEISTGTTLPNPVVIQTGSRLLIRDSITKNQNTIAVTAFDPEYKISRVDWLKQMAVVGAYVLILFILSIIIIALTNAIVSVRLSKKITGPLDLLNYGAEQIKNGNLDFEINYNGKDEFGQAISNFDEMRRRLHQSIQSQLKYEEDRKEIVAGISHDLRTPLTAIKGYVKGLIDGVANTPEKQEQYHGIIYSKACEMDVLVDNLFLFSKLDTGHLPFYFDEVDCKEYMDKQIDRFKDDYETKGLKISYCNNCPSGVPLKIDYDQMNRVFINILDNSAKYKPATVCNVNFEVNSNEYEVMIEISDDGDGVPEEIIPNLFKSFYRGDSSRTNSKGSSGLGLSIADRIIKAHNGTIRAENKKGFKVIINLPISKGEKE
ncbi:sensor histidine kinase [Sinanaerobacter chloroacetimidivorans]|uniref:histidine kinase n=1 Tax=Sinanaerobacter chloroacetimidivorans TaxID=2818044 RepID=A0A8J8B1P7_9FIRM|nr:HAMP domain-containing sensor histidine kinase [Sinanaerobacter chloroacetimidivorans]MBR0598464.1 HAMP domain-containing histidine kinase [Sinanaerobacter chloroacetimidivorans]